PKGNFETADKIFDRALAVSPESFSARALKGVVAILWKGDVDVAEKQLALAPVADSGGLVVSTRVWVMILQRKFPAALQAVQQFPREVLDTHTGRSPKAFYEGLIYLYSGDKAKAQAAFDRARLVAEQPQIGVRPVAQRPALPGVDRAVRGEAIAQRRRPKNLLAGLLQQFNHLLREFGTDPAFLVLEVDEGILPIRFLFANELGPTF